MKIWTKFFPFFLFFFFNQMSDTVYVIRYIGMLSGASLELVTRFSPIVSSSLENPLPLSALPFSNPSSPLPSYCLRVEQKLHRRRCRPTLDMGFQLFSSSTSKRLNTPFVRDFRACKGSIHFRLPLGRIARNCVIRCQARDRQIAS